MKCNYCKRKIHLIRGDLRYTLLNTMQSMILINCEYFYCNRCDAVSFPEDTRASILKKIEETTGNEKIIIKF